MTVPVHIVCEDGTIYRSLDEYLTSPHGKDHTNALLAAIGRGAPDSGGTDGGDRR